MEQLRLDIAGRAYPPRSSKEFPATLSIHGAQARLDAEDGSQREMGRGELNIEAPLGGAARRILLPDGTLFWTEDMAAVSTLERELGLRRLHGFEAFRPRLIGFVALALLGAWAVWRFALPAVIWVAVAMTPQPLRDAMDDGTVQAFDRFLMEETALSKGSQDEVRDILADLVAASDTELPEITLLFRDMPGVGPNAMALPGGTVIVTDALVTEFDDPDVIAGVLGHEIGHVVDNHGLRQVYRSLGFYVLVTLIAGDTGPVLEELLLEGGLILSLTYSREFEREADNHGLDLAARAGYDPAGLLQFFESLPDATETDSGWASTHPASGERIDAIRRWIATN